jgi:long-chain acyl-CoA synthetase
MAARAGDSWLFDVDATLIDGITGGHLRPHARTLLETLRERGVRVLLWSSGGAEYALRRARQHGFDHLIDGSFAKRRPDPRDRWDLPTELHARPRLVLVDDVPDEVPEAGVVVRVRPYLGFNPHDTGLADLLRSVQRTDTDEPVRRTTENQAPSAGAAAPLGQEDGAPVA